MLQIKANRIKVKKSQKQSFLALIFWSKIHRNCFPEICPSLNKRTLLFSFDLFLRLGQKGGKFKLRKMTSDISWPLMEKEIRCSIRVCRDIWLCHFQQKSNKAPTASVRVICNSITLWTWLHHIWLSEFWTTCCQNIYPNNCAAFSKLVRQNYKDQCIW